MVADCSKMPAQNGDISIENYRKDTAIWLPCPKLVWSKATLLKDFCPADGRLHVKLEDETEKIIPVSDFSTLPSLCNPEFLIDTSDLTTLSYLHEPDVLYSLKYRFDLGHIYTYCGIVLVAVNPYRECDLYGCNIFRLYRDTNVRQLDPHVYAVAEEAFGYLTRYDKNQSIIISGESGAGKTVSAKYVMQYLAEACSSNKNSDKDIEKRVLASNPIMEAIGNAKTTRNDNSSRFGKFIQLLFAKNYSMNGASMRTYLLEKSRVVSQNFNERNYHIFYQMCAAKDKDATLNGLFLDSAKNFTYLNKGNCVTVNDIDDSKRFFETKQAMQLVGISDDYLRQIFEILSGLLQFGNVNFDDNLGNLPKSASDGSADLYDSESERYFSNTCQLWGVKPAEFRKWMQYRLLKAGHEILNRSLTPQQAASARDATAKLIYLRLFNWIVERINFRLGSNLGKENEMSFSRFVGVLDIYGFEIFESNSFEQLCINYANEMLQQQFNQHVFKLEQAEYVKEGIKWSFINFSDNQPCLDLIEGRFGILDLLDQECKLPKANDENWLNIMAQQERCSKSAYFSLPRIRKKPGDFVINHFAGSVKYSVNGFTVKNVDSINQEQTNVLKNSACLLLAEILRDSNSGIVENGFKDHSHGASSKKCLASQFKDSLHELRRVLDSTMPHYIRCIKPNDEKLSFNFCVLRTVEQLRACGVLETIRISASGYPSRWTYDEFSHRYRTLLSKRELCEIDKNTKNFANIVCTKFLQPGKFEFGTTKIFFRTGQVALLESIRSEKLRISAILIQKTLRGFIARRRYTKLRNAVKIIQVAGRAWISWRYCKFIQMHRASVVIQSNYQAWSAKKRFLRIRNATVVFQCFTRRWLAQRQLMRLKDEELSKKQRLEQLVDNEEDKILMLTNLHELDVRNYAKKTPERDELNVSRLRIVELESKIVEMTLRIENSEREFAASKLAYETEIRSLKDETVKLKTQLVGTLEELARFKENEIDKVPNEMIFGGMLNVKDADQFLRLIITDFTCNAALKYPTNLPSYLLFMAVRYADDLKSIELLQKLLNNSHERIVYIISSYNDFDILTLWIANVWRFMQLCRQYSGEEEYSKYNTARQSSFELKNHDLSNFRTSLTDLVLKIYEKLIDTLFLNLFTQTKIVAAVLEHDSSHLSGKNGYGNGINAMKLLLDHLNYVYDRFSVFGVEWALSSQIFRHLFSFMEAHAFNVLMSRRDLCNFTKCVEIKHNIKTLLNWLRDRSLSNADYGELDRLKEATNLLHARKTEQDIVGINDICPTLNVAQIIKLLTAYSPTESYEPKISADFVRKLEKLLKEQRKMNNNNEKTTECLCLPTNFCPLLNFQYVQSSINIDEIKIPNFLLPVLNAE